MPQVAITGWSKGLQTAECIQLLHSAAGLPLSDAKSVIEKVLRGEKQEVRGRTDTDARLLAAALNKLGATAHVKAEEAS